MTYFMTCWRGGYIYNCFVNLVIILVKTISYITIYMEKMFLMNYLITKIDSSIEEVNLNKIQCYNNTQVLKKLVI